MVHEVCIWYYSFARMNYSMGGFTAYDACALVTGKSSSRHFGPAERRSDHRPFHPSPRGGNTIVTAAIGVSATDIMVSSINYDRWPVRAIPILVQQVWTRGAALQRVMIEYPSSSHVKFNRKCYTGLKCASVPVLPAEYRVYRKNHVLLSGFLKTRSIIIW